MNLQEELRGLFAEQPDMLYGFADISYSPFYPQYKCALVFVVPYGGRMTLRGYTEEDFHQTLLAARSRVTAVTEQVEALLRRADVPYCVPQPAQRNEAELMAPFSFKYAAVRAGLGWIGRSDVLITERYGPEQRLAAILLDAQLTCALPVETSHCSENCTACVDACPHRALTGKTWNGSVLRSELIDYQLCNQKRSAYIKAHGRKHECGLCLAACPIGRAGSPNPE